MGAQQRFIRLICLVFFLVVMGWVPTGTAGVPAVDHTMITDVTTVSFSVIWSVSEASTASLEVFEDEDGLIPLTSAIITPHPVESGDNSIRIAAENNGVMKVRVTGLDEGSTYYFKTVTTSKSTSDTITYPDNSPLLSITTELTTVRSKQSGSDEIPFSNDIIIEPCYMNDGVTPAEGTLLLATMEGADYPLTSFVGDGVELPNALIDLNNAFGRDSRETLDLEQGKNLTLLNFRGILGNSIVTYDVPDNEALSEMKAGDYMLKPGWNFISVQLDPFDTNLQIILSPIWDNVTSVWAYDAQSSHWSRYDKNNPFPWLNDLNAINFSMGYWLFMERTETLKIDGQLVMGETVNLYAGWNLVGFSSVETLPLSEAISSIEDKINSVWTYNNENANWLRYDKNNPFPWLNNLNAIEPGKAYWIDASEDVGWNLPNR